MPLIYEEDNGYKKFCESHTKPKGGFVVRLSWYMLETFSEKIAEKLGDRKRKKREALIEARKRAHR
jgi:hypothetical protein